MGFLTNLIDKISQIMEIDVKLNEKQYFICPNCSNRIEIKKINQDYCEACGLNLSNFNNYIQIEGVRK
jgi:transcription initiation factor IIE alpha subunit